MSEDSSTPKKRFGYVAIFLVLIVGLLGGGLAVAGVVASHMHGFGGMRGMHMMGHMRHMDGPASIENSKEMAQFMVGRLARHVDATPDQKAKLTAIAESIAVEIQPTHQKFRAAHKRAHELFLQPTIDRTALEALRVEQLALADEVSKKLVAAMADAGDVLTPEQRAKLAQRHRF